MGIYGIQRPIKFIMSRFLTILTPTYNRAKLLKVAWESLFNQDVYDFEWIVVDDGSTDDTTDVITDLKGKSPFKITYVFQSNGGKHRAINKGVQLSELPFVCILDSDDELEPNFCSSLIEIIENTKSIAGLGAIVGRIRSKSGVIYGKKTYEAIFTDVFTYRYKMGITGDHFEVFKRSAMIEFPFPDIANEKFVPEALVWNRIGAKYNFYFVPVIFQVREYLDGGLTDKIVEIRMKSPMASMLTYSELNMQDIPWKEKLKSALNFWRFSFNSGIPVLEKIRMIGVYNTLLLPLGFLLYSKDVFKR
jgi:glycosyltransferase involved in cell wall biosynthesis